MFRHTKEYSSSNAGWCLWVQGVALGFGVQESGFKVQGKTYFKDTFYESPILSITERTVVACIMQ